LSQLAALDGTDRDIVLVYAVSDPSELELLTGVGLASVRVLVVAPEPPIASLPSIVYLGPGRLSRERLAEAVPYLASRLAWVSGPPAFVDEIAPALRALRARRVHTDYFSGY